MDEESSDSSESISSDTEEEDEIISKIHLKTLQRPKPSLEETQKHSFTKSSEKHTKFQRPSKIKIIINPTINIENKSSETVLPESNIKPSDDAKSVCKTKTGLELETHHESKSSADEKSDKIRESEQSMTPVTSEESKISLTAKESPEEDKSEEDAGKKTENWSQDYDPKNVHYEGDVAVYSDPKSGYQYIWCKDTNQWLPKTGPSHTATTAAKTVESNNGSKTSEDSSSVADPKSSEKASVRSEKTNEEEKSESEGKKSVENKLENMSAEFDPKNVHYEGDVAIYTDPKSGYQYTWCKDTNQWQQKSGITYGFEDDTHTYTDAEGVKYFWDAEKNAWFPKIDDDFMAKYQMSYGFVENQTKPDEKKVEPEKEEEQKVEEKNEKAKGVKRKPEAPLPTWFEMDDQQNTKVYVSNLPTDITEEEFVDLMQKCGLVMRDVQTGKMKVKLYTVPDTDILKGDGLCTYIKIESVELALNLLDGYLYRGKKLKVERAKFEMKGEYNPNLKPKKRKKKDKEKLKKMQEKLFDWRPEKMRGERSKHERIVIVKNLFEPSLFDKDVSLILEYQQDLREECGKCGEVRKVIIYDGHPEGVAQVTMKDPEEADACVTLLNGRWFCKRQLTAEIWDGKTKYKIAETDAQISKRLDKWEKFLETDETGKEQLPKSAEEAA